MWERISRLPTERSLVRFCEERNGCSFAVYYQTTKDKGKVRLATSTLMPGLEGGTSCAQSGSQKLAYQVEEEA